MLPSPDPVPGEYIVTLSPGASNAVLPTVADLTDKYGGRVLERARPRAPGLRGRGDRGRCEGAGGRSGRRQRRAERLRARHRHHVAPVPDTLVGLDRVDQHPTTGDNSYSWNADGAGVHAYILDSGINTSLADFGGRASVGTDERDSVPRTVRIARATGRTSPGRSAERPTASPRRCRWSRCVCSIVRAPVPWTKSSRAWIGSPPTRSGRRSRT